MSREVATSELERELKFDVPTDAELPPLDDLDVADRRQVTLIATYWDTADHRLMSWGCSLRHRIASDGSESGWTLKIPRAGASGDTVERREISMDGGPGAAPDDLLDLVSTVVLGGDVRPIATVTTQRSIVAFSGTADAAGVELCDDRVESTVDGAPGPAFREVEAELIGSGGDKVLDDLRVRMHRAGFETSTNRSKIQRVLGGRPTLIAARKRLPEDASVRDFLVATIGSSTRQLLLNDPGVRLGEDVEAIHQARVATRRLRSDLRTFGALLIEEPVDLLRQELAWLGDLLGEVRDPQVLAQRLAAQADEFGIAPDSEDLSLLSAVLVERARFHHTQLVNAMGGDRYRALVADLVRAANDPPVTSAKKATRAARPVVRRLARRQWKRALAFASRLGADATDTDLHEVRRRLKRARYAAQSVKVLRVGSKEFRRELAELQDVLGDHHDLVVQAEFLAGEAARLTPSTAFLAGRMVQDAERRRDEMRSTWPALAARLDHLEFD